MIRGILLRFLFWGVGLFLSFLLIAFLYFFAFYFNFFGSLEDSGINIKTSYPDELVQSRIQSQIEVSHSDTQILFGDTHDVSYTHLTLPTMIRV